MHNAIHKIYFLLWLHNFQIILPSYDEQTQINDFLQKETTQFDELIAKSQSQIKLLQEKRQALINHAVTKGLDPTVPMKDSGVEWIGEIPEHWEVKKLKHLVKQTKDGIKPGPFGSDLKVDDLTDDGYRVYNQRSVIEKDLKNYLEVQQESRKVKYHRGIWI